MTNDKTYPGTALLVMDIQPPMISRVSNSESLLQTLAETIAAVRKAGMPVIYAGVVFRKGFPEISPNNKSFSQAKSTNPTGLQEPIVIHPAVSPQEGDIIVTKRRVSAFTGSDLEVVLRSFKVQHLVLTGISTSGVVLSTLREAADKDYQLTVLSDGCADPDPEVHDLLLSKVFPRQADVLTAAEWVARSPLN
jgi:nicotinamidase-related amidase